MSKINFEECLYFSSARINRVIAKVSDQRFSTMGLSSTEAFILMYLDTGDELNPSSIADELSLDRSTVTRFLDKLENRNYIQRTHKGRQVLVTLTDDGMKLQKQLKKIWSDLNQAYIDMLGEDAEERLRTLLNDDFKKIQK